MKRAMVPTAGEIAELSYCDFVGFIRQTNVPPGAYDTLNRWIQGADISKESHLIEVACTTGFSLREIAARTGCSGQGFDLSTQAITTAQQLAAEQIEDSQRLQWTVSDGYTFAAARPCSHVILGAALGFFPRQREMLIRTLSYFGANDGYLLASPFYIVDPLPSTLVNKAQHILNMTPTQGTWQQVMATYSGLRVEHQQRLDLLLESEEEIALYCAATSERTMKILDLENEEIYAAIFQRLHAIKMLCNELRQHQNYAVLVLGYRQQEFPRRYVELF